MKKTIHCAMFAVLGLSVAGCSNALTNSKAEKMIRKEIHYPETEDVPIQYGLIAHDRDSLPRYYYLLQQKGMFTVEHLGKGGFLVISYRYRVTPSPKAKEYIIGEEQAPVKQGATGEYMYHSRFRTCEVDFEGVESVQEYPGLNAADIRYTVRRSHFTPFWSYYQDPEQKHKDTVQRRTFGAIRTNDGWRPAK
ncbi:MAG TPA: hypothetical protein VHC48_19560 [Puia sp.]|nr:hypothetical protein [Puia sp.]